MAQCDIFPVVVYGADKIMPKKSFLPCWGKWKPQIFIKFLAPISSKGMDMKVKKDLESLRGLVFERMKEAYENLEKEKKHLVSG